MSTPSPLSPRRRVRRSVLRLTERLPVNAVLDPVRTDRPPRNVVVVTGPHRSGTTIMGTLLHHAPRTFLVTEPFNQDWGLAGVPHRYPHLTAADTDSPPALLLRRFLTRGEARWQAHGRPLAPRSPRNRESRRAIRRLRPWGHTTIVKDPFLLLTLGWARRGLTDRPAVVTLRHPCAWVASLLRRSMHSGDALASFRDRDGLGDPVVADLLRGVDERADDVVATGAALWAILTRMLRVQLAGGASAHVVRMEDFAADPLTVLRRTYAEVGLREPEAFGEIVRSYTGGDNLVVPADRTLHVLRRNSAALATAWREQLAPADQHRVRAITEEHARAWYDDW